MGRIFKKSLFILKIILLLIAFGTTLYLMFNLCKTYDNKTSELIIVGILYIINLFIYSYRFFLKVDNSVVYPECVSILTYISIIFINLRSIFDKNMIAWSYLKVNIEYFSNHIFYIKMFLILLICFEIVILIYHKISNSSNLKN